MRIQHPRASDATPREPPTIAAVARVDGGTLNRYVNEGFVDVPDEHADAAMERFADVYDVEYAEDGSIIAAEDADEVDTEAESDASDDATDAESDGSDDVEQDSDDAEGPHRDADAVDEGKCGYYDPDEMDDPCSRTEGWGRDEDDGPCQAHADELN